MTASKGMSIQDLIAGKQKELQAKKSREKTLKPQPGKHIYRVLPSWRGDDDKTFYHDFGIHWVHTPGGGDKPAAAYVCAEKTFGRPCQVCAALDKAAVASKDDATAKLVKDARAAQRYLVNVLHRSGTEPEKPQILEVGIGIFENICELIMEYSDITDPNSGIDIVINRTGSGKDTRYTVMPAATSKPVPKTVLGNIPSLDQYVSQENPADEAKTLSAVGEIIGILPSRQPMKPVPQASQNALSQLAEEAEDADFVEASASVADDLSDLDDLDALLDD